MRRRALDSLRSAIEANTERRSIEQLQAQGKRHVRVVSGEKVMQIITAIVNDIVEREVGETTQRDRDRIVAETKQQFDRVMKMQSEQDRLIQEQKDIVAHYREKLELAVGEATRYKAQADDLRAAQVAREAKLLSDYQEQVQELAQQGRSAADQAKELAAENKRLEQQLRQERDAGREREERLKDEYDQRARDLQREQRDLVARFEGERGELAGRQEQAFADLRTRLEEAQARLTEQGEARVRAEQRLQQLETELEAARAERLAATERAAKAERIIHKLDTRFEKARAALENYDRELQRVIAERDQLAADLAAARERAGESTAVSQLRSEMDELKAFLVERSSGPNEETLETLLTRLSERETVNAQSLEDKFSATLDASLDKITRTMEAATARPIEIEVEATDALVSRLFDLGDDVLSSNMDELEVEVKTSKSGILGNLQALKAMRAGQAVPQEEPLAPASEAEAATDDPSPSGSKGDHAGPEAEAATVPAETRSKMSASMERLKAVRGGEDKE